MPRLSEAARRAGWFLAGPTASGKSEAALALCRRLADAGRPCEILAADSMTLYRGLDVGTAKPTAAERAAVPHRMIDVCGPSESFSVADYVTQSAAEADAVLAAGRVPVFVGGSGLYLRSLLRGVFEGPPADEAVRARIEASGDGPALHARLREADPQAASAIEPNDVRRVVRALEVFELTGRPISDFRTQDEPDAVAARVFWLEPDRRELHRRINARCDRMLAAGWAEEAAALLRRDPPIGETARQALGYAELFEVAEGRLSMAEAAERIKARTRQFAKRQHTWFRNLPECRAVPVAPGETADEVAGRLLKLGA